MRALASVTLAWVLAVFLATSCESADPAVSGGAGGDAGGDAGGARPAQDGGDGLPPGAGDASPGAADTGAVPTDTGAGDSAAGGAPDVGLDALADVGGDAGAPVTDAADALRARVVAVLAQLDGRVVPAAAVAADLTADPAAWTVIDVRSPAEWAAGHIPGALNVPLAELAAFVERGHLAGDRPTLLVCKAGQQSGWAVGLLLLLGYDAWSLDWGMPAWNVAGGNLWAASTGDVAAARRVVGGAPAPERRAWPALDVPGDDVDAALRARALAVLGGPFRLQTWPGVAGALGGWSVVAWMGADGYAAGHLAGAVLVDAGDGLDPPELQALPPDRPLLLYDCTGQTSAAAAALLNVLGYDAWTLKFGLNALWHAALGDCAWSADREGAFDLE
jgi:rhodanese-related sulfurtransferase